MPQWQFTVAKSHSTEIMFAKKNAHGIDNYDISAKQHKPGFLKLTFNISAGHINTPGNDDRYNHEVIKSDNH